VSVCISEPSSRDLLCISWHPRPSQRRTS
jgi:hypothetical protein